MLSYTSNDEQDINQYYRLETVEEVKAGTNIDEDGRSILVCDQQDIDLKAVIESFSRYQLENNELQSKIKELQQVKVEYAAELSDKLSKLQVAEE